MSALTEQELKERLMREELESLQSANLQMRRTILESQQKQNQVKDKARQAYISDTGEIQRQFTEQDRQQHKAINVIKDQYRRVSEVTKRKCTEMNEQI